MTKVKSEIQELITKAKEKCDIAVEEKDGGLSVKDGFVLLPFKDGKPELPISFGSIDVDFLDETIAMVKKSEEMKRKHTKASTLSDEFKNVLKTL